MGLRTITTGLIALSILQCMGCCAPRSAATEDAQASRAPDNDFSSAAPSHADDHGWLTPAEYRARVQANDTSSVPRSEAIRELESLPLPSQTFEGYGGASFTPVAYLVNRGPKGTILGLPAVSVANVVAGQKNVQAFIVTQTILRRLELGYALDRADLGTLPDDIKDTTGADIETHHLWLHNFNSRLLLLDETAFDTPYLPSLTAGVHLKINDGIDDINDRLGDGLGRLGYDQACGMDFTLTMSKTIIHPTTFDRPLFLTVGMRTSNGAQLGLLGFADSYQTTVEAGVGYLLTENLLINYEFRQKDSPYRESRGLIGPEDNWHALGASFMFNEHLMLNAGWAALGTLANTVEDGAWYLQLKLEF